MNMEPNQIPNMPEVPMPSPMSPVDSGSNGRFLTKKKALAGVIIIILLVALPISLKLLQTRQTIKSKAGNDPVVLSGEGVFYDPETKTATSSSSAVTVELTSPDWSTVP